MNAVGDRHPGVILETKRLWLRGWEEADCRRLRYIATDPEVMRYIRNGATWSDEEITRFIDRERARERAHGFCLWAVVLKESRELIGVCGIKQLAETETIEIGWWIARKHWGAGLATEAARAVRDAAFERFGLERLVAVAYPENAASIRIMEKLGMRFLKQASGAEVGTLRKGPVTMYEMRSDWRTADRPAEGG